MTVVMRSKLHSKFRPGWRGRGPQSRWKERAENKRKRVGQQKCGTISDSLSKASLQRQATSRQQRTQDMAWAKEAKRVAFRRHETRIVVPALTCMLTCLTIPRGVGSLGQ